MKYSMFATKLSVVLGIQAATIVSAAADTNTNNPPQSSDTAPLPEQAKDVQSVDLLFQTDSSQLQMGAHAELVRLAQWARCNPDGAVILEGHADPRGTQNYNLKLSAERAAAVREKLIKMGVPSERIVVTIYGENGPRRATYAEDRRVTVRASTRPVPAGDITAQK